ncbi:MAG TPA: substrate-binding domain-containing protein [Pyrinomonadaceae bacterium]
MKLFVALACLFLCACARAPQQQQAPAAARQQPQQKFERPAGVLRVCADPNNLPFSNERGEGFENKIAELLAADMHERLEYTWWAQRRGFFRNTLRAGACDVVLGVPSSFELAATTAPYYRSTYVFVYRKGGGVSVRSFDDEVLRRVKVGVQLVGDDGANTPPAHALAARGVVGNVRGYTLYGDYREPNPPARIVEAVARGEVDVAVAWGPLAGYFVPRQRVALEVVPVSPQLDLPFLPFVYDISMGVRRGDEELRLKLEDFLERRRPEVERILDDYGVPRAPEARVADASPVGRGGGE